MTDKTAIAVDAKGNQPIEMVGMVSGRLTVVSFSGYDKYRKREYLCECECGNRVPVLGVSIRSGRTKSCGCLQRDLSKKHGGFKLPEYGIWTGMWARCSNPKIKAYKWYGARGITVCERWRDFSAFYEDMGPRTSPKHSIDRIDNDGNYEPGNCRWATSYQQANNQRHPRQRRMESHG